MQSADLFQFGKGGGSFYGEGKVCRLENWRFAEHSFVKTGPDKKTIVETFPPGAMFGFDVYSEERESDDPEFVTQWYPVGSLPYKRMVELGYGDKVNVKDFGTGGYSPSTDNENPAVEGGFIVMDSKSDIWDGCPYAQLFDEFKQLNILEHADKAAVNGVAAFNGTRAVMGIKVLPKSKGKLKKEQLTGEVGDSKKILVPTQIVSWPWDANTNAPAASAPKPAAPAAATAASAAAPKAAASAPTAASAPATAATAATPAAANTDAVEAKTIGYVKQIITSAGGEIAKTALPMALLKLAVKDGTNRGKIVQLAGKDEWLQARSDAGDWLWNAEAGTLLGL